MCFCPQAVERLVQAADSGCPSEKQRQIVLNCVRLLTRILPYIFEDADWRGFFWSTVPGAGRAGVTTPTHNLSQEVFWREATNTQLRPDVTSALSAVWKSFWCRCSLQLCVWAGRGSKDSVSTSQPTSVCTDIQDLAVIYSDSFFSGPII